MKVAVLKDFLVAVDDLGVKARSLVAGTVDEVADDITPSLVDEGYVSLRVSDATPTPILAGLFDVLYRNPNSGAQLVEKSLTKEAAEALAKRLAEMDEPAADIRIVPAVQEVPSVDIPADWQKAHHKTRVALAKKLGAAADITADKADELIAAEVARRAGE